MGYEPPLTVRVESRHGVARIAMAGELDMATAPDLMEHVTKAEGDGVTAIMLDLQDLTFIDSTGLHAFLKARENAESNGHRMIMLGAPEFARRLFELTGTGFLLDNQGAVIALEQFTRPEAAQRAQPCHAELRLDA